MKQTLGVQIITWNGEDFLEEVINAVLPYVEQIAIADTGSVDSTPEILKKFKEKYPDKFIILTSKTEYNIKYEEQKRINHQRDHELSQAYNETRDKLTTDWIVKIDDDEIFTPELVEEIHETINKDSIQEVYAIPFLHFETWDTILDESFQKNLFMARLFKNISKYRWVGSYGRRTIASGKTRVVSKKCSRLQNPFLHIGNLRKEGRRHIYMFNNRLPITIPTPQKYYEYLPKH